MPSRAEYAKFFTDADTDKSGSLTFSELIALLKTKGYKGPDAEIKKFFACADTDGDQSVSKDEYMVAMGQQPPEVHGMASMRSCFVEFDADGNGTISRSELDAAMRSMGKSFTEDEIKKMMALMDENKNDCIDYEEFILYFFNKKGKR